MILLLEGLSRHFRLTFRPADKCRPISDDLEGNSRPASREFSSVPRSSRNVRNHVRISSASNSGSSIAAKCPPRAISVQRFTLKNRSAHSRGGWLISFGKSANAAGTLEALTHFLTPSLIQVSALAFA